VDAGTQDDKIFADDGAPDFIDCAEGRDEVVFDATLDKVADNCEIQHAR
jgi:hypothetical protein